MTLRDLINAASDYGLLVLGLFALLPAATFVTGLSHPDGAGGKSPWRMVYAVLVYLACVPGICAVMLVGYALFFTGDNLLDVSLVVYGMPTLSMVATLVLMGRRVDFDEVPGFDRLTGMMTLMALSFLVIFAMQRTRIWILFGGSIWMLLGIGVLIYLGLTWAAKAAFGGADSRGRDDL